MKARAARTPPIDIIGGRYLTLYGRTVWPLATSLQMPDQTTPNIAFDLTVSAGGVSHGEVVSPLDPVVQHIKPELRFLLGLLAQFPSQLRNFLRQPWLSHRFRHRLSCGCWGLRNGIFIQAGFSSSYRIALPVRPLRSTDVIPLLRYYGPLRLPAGAHHSYLFPWRVGRLRCHPTGSPRLLG